RLVSQGVESHLPDSLQELAESAAPRDLHSQSDQVHKVTDDRFSIAVGTIGDIGEDYEIALATGLGEQDPVDREEGHERCRNLFLRQLSQLVGQIRSKARAVIGASTGSRRRAWPI